jgi:hypothetical protein
MRRDARAIAFGYVEHAEGLEHPGIHEPAGIDGGESKHLRKLAHTFLGGRIIAGVEDGHRSHLKIRPFAEDWSENRVERFHHPRAPRELGDFLPC